MLVGRCVELHERATRRQRKRARQIRTETGVAMTSPSAAPAQMFTLACKGTVIALGLLALTATAASAQWAEDDKVLAERCKNGATYWCDILDQRNAARSRGGARPVFADITCTVNAPDGELNVRELTPNGGPGKIIGVVKNGNTVTMRDFYWFHGKSWARVLDGKTKTKLVGWMFKDYLNCGNQQAAAPKPRNTSATYIELSKSGDWVAYTNPQIE
jgi:hypothetical protein